MLVVSVVVKLVSREMLYYVMTGKPENNSDDDSAVLWRLQKQTLQRTNAYAFLIDTILNALINKKY